jgi:hypothetical protein
VWSTINTDTDPKAAEKLIAGELFDDGCPKCGKVHPLNYPMVFHDPEQMVMISYILDAADYRDKVAEIEELFEDQPQVAPESGYRHRIVTTQNALREKAVIFYNGLDDRLVEMLKVIYSEQVLAQYPNVQFKNVFFLINPKGDWFMQFIADRLATILIGYETSVENGKHGVFSFFNLLRNPLSEDVIKVRHVTEGFLSDTEGQTDFFGIYVAVLTLNHGLSTIAPENDRHGRIKVDLSDFGEVGGGCFNIVVTGIHMGFSDVSRERHVISRNVHSHKSLSSLFDKSLLTEYSVSFHK